MINSVAGLKPGQLFTRFDDEVWEVTSLFACPSVTLKNLRTGDVIEGGIGCLNFEYFTPLVREDGRAGK